MIERVSIGVKGQGLYPITRQIAPVVSAAADKEGLCTLFIRHTSASLLIQENYDDSARVDLRYQAVEPVLEVYDDSARVDLENWFNRLVPENDPIFTHTIEGPDDMPSHIKSALTATQLSIPFENNELLLGTWQGIYLWEHRHHAGQREVLVHL